MNILAIEGVDGSGKSTICQKLYERLSTLYPYLKIQKYSEPYFLKEYIYSTPIQQGTHLLLLFLTSRKMLLSNILSNFQNQKPDIILMDRYIDSTLVYQVLLQKAIDFETFTQIHQKIIFDNLDLYPSLTFILEADPEDIKERIRQKNHKKMFDTYQPEQIMQLYRLLPLIIPDRLFFFFNTSRLSVDEVISKMIKIIVDKIILVYKGVGE
ncbi:MAG: deoxynucleoside kinase [bacterium]